MAMLPIFEELVASEAAIRADYIYRHKQFTFRDRDGEGVISYDATNPDRGNSRDEVASRLFDNFIKTYNYMFKDSSQHAKLVEAKVCNTRDLHENDLQHLRDIFQEFSYNYYDGQGNPTLTRDTAADALHQLYKEITQEVPLHHAGMALGTLLVELGRGDKWKNITPDGIDFTRGEPTDDAKRRIQDAISAPQHKPTTSSFIPFPESVEEIAGIKFPVKKGVEGWRTFLITETGHMVDMTTDFISRLSRHITSGKPLSEFKVDIKPDMFHLWQFEQPISSGRTQKARQVRQKVRDKLEDMAVAERVDGMPVKNEQDQHHPVALASMDVDVMTGLDMRHPKEASELKIFKAFLAKQGYAEISDLLPVDFTDNIHAMQDENQREQARGILRKHVTQVLEGLIEKAADDPALQSLVKRAAERLEHTLPNVYELTDKAFIDADSGQLKQAPSGDAEPKMYLSMGGTASGKGGLKALAKKECGKDLVVASLDDARDDSERQWLYLALNNHNDDYKAVEEFAKGVREVVTKRALKGHYNLFIDGSGVPYENRNDKISQKFKENGYNVSVLAAQAPLFINDPEKRRELSAKGMLPNDSTARLGYRLDEELRAVPMDVVADKHIGFALASRNAARDINVDRFMIEDVSGPMGTGYTLSYVLTLPEHEMKTIADLQGEALKSALNEHNLVPEWVKLPQDGDSAKNYDMKVIRDNQDGTYRVEIITNIGQYVNMVQKGLLRRDAKGPEAWFDNTIRSDIEGHFKAPGGKLRLQSPQGVVDMPWVNYDPMSKLSRPATSSWARE